MSTAAPSPGSVSIGKDMSLERLPDDPVALKQMIVELVVTLRQERRDGEALRHRLDALLRRLYGPRNERYDPNQPWLFADLAPGQGQQTAAPTANEPERESKPKRRCRPHGRRLLPPQLPREPKHHELSQAERVCGGCGQARIDVGVDKSEQLEYRPASMIVIEHFVHKYACPCCSRPQPEARQAERQQDQETEPMPLMVVATQPEEPMEPRPEPTPPGQGNTDPSQASRPEQQRPEQQRAGSVIAAAKPTMPIPKGLPGPGLLAHLIVCKHVDHLPLHRLERIYERQGVFLPRSTLCDWLAASAQLLRPLYERMVAVVLQSRVVHTDDTPVDMQDRATRGLITARLWTYLGDGAHPYNVFDFTTSRKRDGPQRFLANFQGYLQADAFSGYDCLYLPSPADGVARIIEVACNAHARRKFYDARASDEVRAHLALAYFGQLYELERAAKDFAEAQRLQMRQDLSLVILKNFHTWLETEHKDVLPKSPLGEAIGYALNNWDALKRYTEAGFLAIDNNVAEREMKRIAIGRKNWLFVGSERGGKTAAILFSFTSTCTRLGVEPWAYLQDVLTRLPNTPPTQLADLLPDHWQAARKAAPSVNASDTPR